MITKHFAKSCHGKIYSFFSVIIFVALALFLTEGCEKSDYEKALNGEDIAAETQAISDTTPGTTTSGTSETTTIIEVTDTDITDGYVLTLIKKSLNIKALGAFHSSLNMWSAQLNINKSSGAANGYIFISYVEAALDGGSTEINTSVLKANLKGAIDMKTLDFKGRTTGNIAADRDDFFSGDIDLETTGKLSADYNQFTGNFTTPSYVVFDFILVKK